MKNIILLLPFLSLITALSHNELVKFKAYLKAAIEQLYPKMVDTDEVRNGYPERKSIEIVTSSVKIVKKHKSAGLPPPPNCAVSNFGCCWDKLQPKKDDQGSNCPKCKNKFVYICRTFREDCKKQKNPRTFMLKYCPETCGVCKTACEKFPEVCQSLSELGIERTM